MKGNTEKCYLMLSTRDSNKIETGNSLVKGSLSEKLLGVKFNHNLTFNKHVKSLCKKKKKCKIESVSWVRSIYGISEKKITNKFLFCCTIKLLNDSQPF